MTLSQERGHLQHVTTMWSSGVGSSPVTVRDILLAGGGLFNGQARWTSQAVVVGGMLRCLASIYRIRIFPTGVYRGTKGLSGAIGEAEGGDGVGIK
jgi:hypothetical protein